MGVDQTFRFAGCAGCVQDEQRVFRIHHLCFTILAVEGHHHQIVVPEITVIFHVALFTGAFHRNTYLDGGRTLHRFIRD